MLYTVLKRKCLEMLATSHLELRVGVLEDHLEVCLVPLTGLGRGFVGVSVAAERVVADGRSVAGAVRLASRLAPDESVDTLDTSVGGGADTEASAVNIAPVTPLLTKTSNTVTRMRCQPIL